MEKEIVNSKSSPDQNARDFECNICLQLARDPVVTPCGHVFCWPCLYTWLHSYSESQNCAVCRAVLQEKELVRINDSCTTQSDALSSDVPHRPAASRFASFTAARGFGDLTASASNNIMSRAASGFGDLIASVANNVMSPAFPDATVHKTVENFL